MHWGGVSPMRISRVPSGKASNPAPVQTRQARKLEEDNERGVTQVDVSSEEGLLVRPNIGRSVVARTASRRHESMEHREIPHGDVESEPSTPGNIQRVEEGQGRGASVLAATTF